MRYLGMGFKQQTKRGILKRDNYKCTLCYGNSYNIWGIETTMWGGFTLCPRCLVGMGGGQQHNGKTLKFNYEFLYCLANYRYGETNRAQ